MSRHWLAWCGVIVLLGAGVAIAERPWASLRDRLAAGTFACEPRNEPTSAVTVQSPPTTYDALCDRNVHPYPRLPSLGGGGFPVTRSEERRGGEERRAPWAPDHLKKKDT